MFCQSLFLLSMVSTSTSATESAPPSSQDSPMDDPLFLHHEESPSLVLVTHLSQGVRITQLGHEH